MFKRIAATVLALTLLVVAMQGYESSSIDGATTTIPELTAEDTLNHFTINIQNNDFISYGDNQLDAYTLGDEVMFRVQIWPKETGEYQYIKVYFYAEALTEGAYYSDLMWSPDSKSDDMTWYDIDSFNGMKVVVEDSHITYWISMKFQVEGDYRMVAYATDYDGELAVSSNYRYIKIEDGAQITRYSNSEIAEMGYSLYLDDTLPHETETAEETTTEEDTTEEDTDSEETDIAETEVESTTALETTTVSEETDTETSAYVTEEVTTVSSTTAEEATTVLSTTVEETTTVLSTTAVEDTTDQEEASTDSGETENTETETLYESETTEEETDTTSTEANTTEEEDTTAEIESSTESVTDGEDENITDEETVTIDSPSGLAYQINDDGTITVTWQSVEGADTYRVYFDGTLVQDTANLSYTFDPGEDAYYVVDVCAVSDGVESSRSRIYVRPDVDPNQETEASEENEETVVADETESSSQTTNLEVTSEEATQVSVKSTKVKKKTKYLKAKKIKVSLKKVSGADGYIVKVSKKKSFKKKNIILRKSKIKNKFKIKSAKFKKFGKVYIKARAYKVVNGKKYKSKWSKARKVKNKFYQG